MALPCVKKGTGGGERFRRTRARLTGFSRLVKAREFSTTSILVNCGFAKSFKKMKENILGPSYSTRCRVFFERCLLKLYSALELKSLFCWIVLFKLIRELIQFLMTHSACRGACGLVYRPTGLGLV